MTDNPGGEERSRFWLWYRRFVDVMSTGGLFIAIGTTIYCLERRSHYERSYAGALVVALVGLAVMLIAWVQQVIAARDLASWREMVELQIRAAHWKIAAQSSADDLNGPYFEALIETLITDMQSTIKDGEADDETVI